MPAIDSRLVTGLPASESVPEPAGEALPVRRALISVSDKTGVADFAKGLAGRGSRSSPPAGPLAAIEEAGVEVRAVEDLTGFPEILDGRVKTLHPHLHAALLAVRDNPEHAETLRERAIEPIDLVCMNLYPFERTIARRDVPDDEAIENIDVGGPTMIRAAAKNHRYVAVVVQPESYDAVLAELEETGELSAATRHWLANEAFAATARYDAAISRWFGRRYEQMPAALGHLLGEGARPRLRREPPPARRALRRSPARGRTCSRGWRSCTARRSRSTTCSTSTRRGASAATSTEPAA